MKTIEAQKGHSIYNSIQMAIREAQKCGGEVSLIFNEITLILSPYSHDVDIATIYNLKHRIRQLESK